MSKKLQQNEVKEQTKLTEKDWTTKDNVLNMDGSEVDVELSVKEFQTARVVDIEKLPKEQEAKTKSMESKTEIDTHKNETNLEFVNRLKYEYCTFKERS